MAFGLNHEGQCTVPELPCGTRYVAASAGVFHSLLVRDDGVAVAFGCNGNGRCDVPDLPPGVRYVDPVKEAPRRGKKRPAGKQSQTSFPSSSPLH